MIDLSVHISLHSPAKRISSHSPDNYNSLLKRTQQYSNQTKAPDGENKFTPMKKIGRRGEG